ncbi:MAG: hypothetical protein WDZ35_13205 [Crocinitomicaceae bacterium]
MTLLKKFGLLYLIVLVLCSSCNGSNENTNNEAYNSEKFQPLFPPIKYNVDSLREEIITQGDTNSYKQLCNWAFEIGEREIFLESLIMMNQYNYPEAHRYVFLGYIDMYKYYGLDFKDIDESTQNWLLNVAQEGIDKGCKSCIYLEKEI